MNIAAKAAPKPKTTVATAGVPVTSHTLLRLLRATKEWVKEVRASRMEIEKARARKGDRQENINMNR